jgi:hypothetical protein
MKWNKRESKTFDEKENKSKVNFHQGENAAAYSTKPFFPRE